MKVLFRMTLAFFALAIAASAPLSAQQVSIVYIDSERLRAEAPGLQQARARIQQRMPQLEASADSALAPMQAELQRLAVEFQQQQGMMTAERRQQQQAELQRKQAELQQAGAEWEQRAGRMQNEILAPALTRINQVIDTLRSDRGYSFILDSAGGGVVAADPSLDITDEVLRRLNAAAN